MLHINMSRYSTFLQGKSNCYHMGTIVLTFQKEQL